jgi:nicotinamide-nucleotide amidase
MNQDADTESSLNTLARLALEKGEVLVTAESCTGGLIAGALTAVPGSSAWVCGGFVTYTCAMKQRLLGVSAATLAAHGAVSEECVREMLAGALAKSDATAAVAASGIAGPSGDGSDNPVGTVYLGWMKKGGEPRVRRFQFAGGRAEVRQQSVRCAVEGFIELLSQEKGN